MKRHPTPTVRLKRQTIGLLGLCVVLLVIIIVLAVGTARQPLYEIREDRLMPSPVIHIIKDEFEELAEQPSDGEDVILLAKIMDAEDGHDWPDAMILCIGEVVLNRVASPEFPDTVREVLYQDDGGFIQYAPVHHSGWEYIEPEEHYIELARRLLAGERVMNDPQIVYQALFEQGRGTVLSYHDFYIGSTTYFCLTSKPGLYQ